MSFKELNIKSSNISKGRENIVDALIRPALKEAVLYKRSVGYFSSTVFSLIVDSLPSFIENNGEIRLIVSPNLSEKDIETINAGYEKRKLILEKVGNNFEDEIHDFTDENLSILYELIVRNIMNIKVTSVINSNGIYHDKLGILKDKENNFIVFFGSPNSTFNGYGENYERVRTLKSWKVEDDTVKDEIDEFDSIWDGSNTYLETFDFQDAIKKKIIKEKETREKVKKYNEPIELYDYQKEAINAWIENGYNGFYVMATGTGKTWTAIYSAKKLFERHPCLLVIAAPYKHLVKQWAEDVEKAFPEAGIVLISSENTKWETQATHKIIDQTYHPNKQIILITTISSFYSDKFKYIINKSHQNKMLIVDEAHRFKRRDNKLHDVYKYMLGLSATPLNGKNNEEGKDLLNFFGGQVFNLPIENALAKHFLVPYYYHPIFVNATEDEESLFNQYTARMASCYRNNLLVDKDAFVRYSHARLKVIALAKEKNDRIQELVCNINTKDHFIVYCGDGKFYDENDDAIRHINFVREKIANLGIKCNPFTAEEDMNRRMELVDMFNNKEIDALAAIKCLDEGINIPSIKSALLLASNDDYREFVQRRGRILRRYTDKKTDEKKLKADIYDVIVLPTEKTRKMALIELRRFYEYAKLASNNEECIDKLNTLLLKYGLLQEEIEFYTEVEKEDDLDE